MVGTTGSFLVAGRVSTTNGSNRSGGSYHRYPTPLPLFHPYRIFCTPAARFTSAPRHFPLSYGSPLLLYRVPPCSLDDPSPAAPPIHSNSSSTRSGLMAQYLYLSHKYWIPCPPDAVMRFPKTTEPSKVPLVGLRQEYAEGEEATGKGSMSLIQTNPFPNNGGNISSLEAKVVCLVPEVSQRCERGRRPTRLEWIVLDPGLRCIEHSSFSRYPHLPA
jgi:hypothetical protein